MSGLDADKDVLLEVACVVTEWNLEEVGERAEVIIHQPGEVLDNMNSWCQQHHGEVIPSLIIVAVGCIVQALQNLISDRDFKSRMTLCISLYPYTFNVSS